MTTKIFDPQYEKNYNEAAIDKNRLAEVTLVSKKILENKARYLTVSEKTSIPWDIIACLHLRESSLRFDCVLHNGERIIGTSKKTKLVPAGHGPFSTWEEAAIDALMLKKYLFPKTWSIALQLKFIEGFNGFGYRKRGELSPYVWAGTTKHSEKGKYVADGHYDPNAPEKQLGAVAILKYLRK
jgi:lysozyme family protein